MRFRSLVVSWCVCAIHGSVQIASGHRSLDATSRSTYRPPGDIGTSLVRFPRNIPELPSSTLSLPISRPRSPLRYASADVPKPPDIDERIERQRSKRATAAREKIVELPAKRKRRKKCSCRKRDGRRKIESSSKLGDTTLTESNESSLPSTARSLFTSVGITNIPVSTLNPTTEPSAESSTTPQRFTDIASTTTDAVTSTINAMTITEAAKITTKEADDVTRETYRQHYPRKRCKKIKCATKNCKRRRKKKKNVIEVLDQEFRNNRGNVRASRTKTASSSLENVDLYPIMD